MMSNDYRYLLDKGYFTEEEIFSKAESLYSQCYNFLNTFKQNSKGLYVHEGKLQDLVFDYFADIARLKEFHDIPHESTTKQTAYTAFWVLRNAPIQIAANNKNIVSANELFAVSLIFAEHKSKLGGALSNAQTKVLKKHGREAHYFFRFRHYTQQSIEFALNAFASGADAVA